MEIEAQGPEGLLLIKPKVFRDERGFFQETYSRLRYEQAGINCEFVQDNHSSSVKGTVRGMHFQTAPGQAKLVRASRGRIYDVVVDIRKGSNTFGEWHGVYLDDETSAQLFIPVGFAHGFCVVSDHAEVQYKVTTYYDPKTESGFDCMDRELGIEWPVDSPILSKRDQTATSFSEWKRSLA